MDKKKGLATASLILGLLFWVPLFNIFLGILAVILGVKALKKIKSNPSTHGGKRVAITGIMLGSLPVVLGLLNLFGVF